MCNFEPKQTVPNIAAAWPRLGAGGGVFRGVSNGVDSVDVMTVVWIGVKFYKPIKVTVGECSAPRCSTGGPLLLIF